METRLHFNGKISANDVVRVPAEYHPVYGPVFREVPLTHSPIPWWTVGGAYQAELVGIDYDSVSDISTVILTIAGTRRNEQEAVPS